MQFSACFLLTDGYYWFSSDGGMFLNHDLLYYHSAYLIYVTKAEFDFLNKKGEDPFAYKLQGTS